MNTKITVAYDGLDYSGSQKQPSKTSVEDALEAAFQRLNVQAKIILSGRTDAGVHATGQVFNTVLPEHLHDLKKLQKLLNHQLPLSIRVKKAEHVSDDFHARFSAKKRVYRYLITQEELTVFNARYITHVKTVDEAKIKEAITCFMGEHDFEYFHKQGSDKTNFIKHIYEAKFYKYKNLYVFKFTANSYLRSQIRLMVGFLIQISLGKRTIKELQCQLKKEKRSFKTPINGNGLYLAKVIY